MTDTLPKPFLLDTVVHLPKRTFTSTISGWT